MTYTAKNLSAMQETKVQLRVSWTSKISTRSILKEISPEYSLERLMLKLKLQYFSADEENFEKTLLLEKIEGGRRKG